MPKVSIDITLNNNDNTLLSLLLDGYDELRDDVAKELAVMARELRKPWGGANSITSHKVDDVWITVNRKAKHEGE